MTLQQFLSAFQPNGTMVTLMDVDANTELMTFKAEGFASLDDTIEAKEVKRWEITSSTSMRVYVGA